jgi:hypothetical protein
MITGLTR